MKRITLDEAIKIPNILDRVIVASYTSLSIQNIFQYTTDCVLLLTMKSVPNCYKIFYKDKGKVVKTKILKSDFNKLPEIKFVYSWDGTSINNSVKVVYKNTYAGQHKFNDRALMVRGGVSIPPTLNLGSGPHCDPNCPYIVRPFKHARGEDAQIMDFDSTVAFLKANNRTHYGSLLIDKDREFRVHCGAGKVISVLEKHRPNDGNVLWNRAVDESNPFQYINWNNFDELIISVMRQALRALSATDAYHGGVDVITKGGDVYILEVNKAVSVDPDGYMAKKYAMFLDKCLRENWTNRRYHFQFESYTKGKSFIWKKAHFKVDELNSSEVKLKPSTTVSW